MTVRNVTDYGVRSDGSPVAEALEAVFRDAKDGEEVYFPAGVYYLERAVPVTDKNSLSIRGEGATLVTHFSATEDISVNNDALRFSRCRGLELSGFTCVTDNPFLCMGRVTDIDWDARTYDVLLDEGYTLTGWEHIYGSNTFDEDGSPDKVVESYDPITREEVTDERGEKRLKITGLPYTCLSPRKIRVNMPRPGELFSPEKFHTGYRMVYRFEIYGNSLFFFEDCHTVTLRDIEVNRCCSMGVVIRPRCSDFTLENVNFRPAPGDPSLYCAGADAIHILGLCGYIHLKNCYFDGIGDDALNIHGLGGTVVSYDPGTGMLLCRRGEKRTNLPPDWASVGDTIRIYDSRTFLEKGRAVIDSFDAEGNAHVTSLTGSVAVGDELANGAYFAAVTATGCVVRNTRARGFLLQSENMLIENSQFYGISHSAVLVSPDARRWHEVGPSRNVEIRGCDFDKCCFTIHAENQGAVLFNACHQSYYNVFPAGVHRGIKIRDNTFRNIGSSGVFVCAGTDVDVSGNRFEDCSCSPYDPSLEETEYDVIFKNCEDAVCRDNTTTKDPSKILIEYSIPVED